MQVRRRQTKSIMSCINQSEKNNLEGDQILTATWHAFGMIIILKLIKAKTCAHVEITGNGLQYRGEKIALSN